MSVLDVERYRLAFEDSAIGMAIEDVDGRYVQVNPALCAMVGYSAEQLLTMRYQDICHPDDLEGPGYLAALTDGSVRRAVKECRYRCADGRQIWVRVHIGVIHVDGAAVLYTAQIEDITAQKDAEERLIFQASHDDLTGLPNRKAFAERIVAEIEAGGRPALLFVDLDRFKLVNDTLGHVAGDELLITAAQRLRRAVRDGDVVARIGGDEFVVLAVSAPTLEGAEQLAERLHEEMSAPFRLGGRSLILTVSIGIAIAGRDVTSAEDMLRAADLAMYRSKTTGRARTAAFDASMWRDAARRLAIEQDLRRLGDAPDQLRVWFQPVVSLATRRIVTAEALVRWQHPERGLLLPAEFLPVAEEAGLMAPITNVVMSEALRQARRWRDLGLHVGASINLSAPQLDDAEFDRKVALQLAEAGLEPPDLSVEVTETVLVDADGAAARTVQKLRDLGVGVAIDDFGQGYSSLSYLRRYPVDVIKLDRAFVESLEVNPRDAAIVGGVIQLAHALGVSCVAEGVERASQLRQLRSLGCDLVQGYLLFEPCPADELFDRLRANGTGVALPSLVGA
ncbi:MAG TPA: EAL domain-containing protein [Acidimicrobiales bacterium]|nr:EAL domain-containing protein [Acidimicrobiales bacterium]